MTHNTSNLVSYETTCLLKSNVTEEFLLSTIEQHKHTLNREGAKNIVVQNKGQLHLKYPINKILDSIRIQINYDANGKVVRVLEHSLKVDESVLRFLTIRTSSRMCTS
uniref:Ribosomal protein S6 n=1 Tax=Cryptomonas sp. CCAC 1634B TaxID=2051848 RepID=A0A679CAH7_9CRYP|nr:ribosomal protein S6 [Cryptomonas sp. CCAC 1634B]